MPDYITLFCDMQEDGVDMTDVKWEEFEMGSAEALFEHIDSDNNFGVQ